LPVAELNVEAGTGIQHFPEEFAASFREVR